MSTCSLFVFKVIESHVAYCKICLISIVCIIVFYTILGSWPGCTTTKRLWIYVCSKLNSQSFVPQYMTVYSIQSKPVSHFVLATTSLLYSTVGVTDVRYTSPPCCI